MSTAPYTRACAAAGCAAAVARGGYCAAHGRKVDQARGLTSDRIHKALYNSARWRRLRRDLLTARPFCECEDCRGTARPPLAVVVHHRRPHHGDPVLFFDVANLQPMAKSCHDRVTRGVWISKTPAASRPSARSARETGGFAKGV